MAFSQYSTARKVNEDPPEEDPTGGSSSFSNWKTLIEGTATRKRHLGRVKIGAMPKRTAMKTTQSPEKSHPMPQRPMPQRLGYSPTRTNSSSSESSGEPSDRHMLPKPQRPNPNMRNSPEKSFPMPQRMNARDRQSPEKSYPMPQRLNTSDRNTLPQKMVNDLIKTPEMPQLKSLNFSSSIRPTANARHKSPPVKSPSFVRMRGKRSPSPESRSKSTPPPMPSSQPPPIRSQGPQTYPSLDVNGKSYFVMDKIGKGGSSQVFQVLEVKSSTVLAIKRVDMSGVSDLEAKTFRQEIELLKRLQGNQRIVKLIDYEERMKSDGTGQELLVVMEKGSRDLGNLIKELSASEDGLTDAEIKFYWEGMLKGVAVVHRENIVHKDLKPANFLIVEGMLKLIDFGIASRVQDGKTQVTIENQMGTLNYISPETLNPSQTTGSHKIGFKSDVWSLGCILYNLVYKKLPFSHLKNTFEKMQAIINPEHKINFPRDQNSLQGHDPRVVDVLQRCLVRDVKQRASIQELLNHSYLKSEPIKVVKNHLEVDLKSYEQMTPNTFKREIMKNLTNSKNLAPPPAYSQDS